MKVMPVTYVEQNGYKLNILEIARAKKNGKTLLNEQLEFSISHILKLAIEDK